MLVPVRRSLLSSVLFSSLRQSLAQSSLSLTGTLTVATAGPIETAIEAPQCAETCLLSAIAVQPCESTDIRCLCLHTNAISDSTNRCLEQSPSETCSPSDLDAAAAYYPSLCNYYHYPSDQPPSASGLTTVTPTEAIVSATEAPPQRPSAASSATAVSTPKSTVTSTVTSTADSGGLSVLEILGISLAGSLGFMAIFAGLVWFILSRRASRARLGDAEDGHNEPQFHRSDSSASTLGDTTEMAPAMILDDGKADEDYTSGRVTAVSRSTRPETRPDRPQAWDEEGTEVFERGRRWSSTKERMTAAEKRQRLRSPLALNPTGPADGFGFDFDFASTEKLRTMP